MRCVRLHMSAQAHAQLSSRAQFAAHTSFMKNIHPSTKESSYNRIFTARTLSYMRDWQRTSNLITERPAVLRKSLTIEFLAHANNPTYAINSTQTISSVKSLHMNYPNCQVVKKSLCLQGFLSVRQSCLLLFSFIANIATDVGLQQTFTFDFLPSCSFGFVGLESICLHIHHSSVFIIASDSLQMIMVFFVLL